MSKKSQEKEPGKLRRHEGPSLTKRLEAVRSLNEISSSSRTRRKYTTNIQHIADALVAAGFTSLDKQAKALGIHRATAWTIVRTKHKLGRLNLKTTERILANPELPPRVRSVVEQYLAERPARARQQVGSRAASIGMQSRENEHFRVPTGVPLCDETEEKRKRGRLQS